MVLKVLHRLAAQRKPWSARDNRNVAITLFRDYLHEASPQPAAFPLRLEPRRIDVNRVLAV